MAMTQPIWGFTSISDTGIHKAPLNKLIHIYGTGALYELTNKTGLISTSTVSEAIQAGNLTLISGSGGGGSGGAASIAYEEFIATEGQTSFNSTSVSSNSLFTLNGIFVRSTNVTKLVGTSFTFSTACREGDVIGHLYSSSVAGSLLVNQKVIAAEGQTTITLDGAIVDSVYLNGIFQIESDDYTVSGNTLTFIEPLSANAVVLIRHY